MKKFLTILSFLTTLTSSLVVVACKTDNVDKEVKNKENKNEQNNNPRDNKNNKDSKNTNYNNNNNNLKEKDNENKDKKIEHKENNNIDKLGEERQPDGQSSPGKSENSSHNLGTQPVEPKKPENYNNSSGNSSEEQPQADELPKEEKGLNSKTVEYKQKIDTLIEKKNDNGILTFFTDLYSEIIEDEFNNKWSKKIAEANSKVTELFDQSGFENIMSKINTFISDIFGKDSNWNEEDKKKLIDLLKKGSSTNKEKTLEYIDQLFLDITGKNSKEKLEKEIAKLEKILTQKDYNKVKEIVNELVSKIEKISIITNISLLN
ncbi:hypothetical protein [Mycoplasma feriruminatoris]|uniref:hypothetical protein n=1 Tax=Mycoplasma feriruminatoris TaxID=1179777 RepID=UPI00241F16AE|nr:hypothetical protein [Mycoplasma feriruminatoris]WFQ90230.1 hypothetical protein MFERI11561_00481 [Mycoplasma feriruminatoris]